MNVVIIVIFQGLSWKLKEKFNEVAAYKEKINLAEERNKVDVENLKKQLQVCYCFNFLNLCTLVIKFSFLSILNVIYVMHFLYLPNFRTIYHKNGIANLHSRNTVAIPVYLLCFLFFSIFMYVIFYMIIEAFDI